MVTAVTTGKDVLLAGYEAIYTLIYFISATVPANDTSWDLSVLSEALKPLGLWDKLKDCNYKNSMCLIYRERKRIYKRKIYQITQHSFVYMHIFPYWMRENNVHRL